MHIEKPDWDIVLISLRDFHRDPFEFRHPATGAISSPPAPRRIAKSVASTDRRLFFVHIAGFGNGMAVSDRAEHWDAGNNQIVCICRQAHRPLFRQRILHTGWLGKRMNEQTR